MDHCSILPLDTTSTTLMGAAMSTLQRSKMRIWPYTMGTIATHLQVNLNTTLSMQGSRHSLV